MRPQLQLVGQRAGARKEQRLTTLEPQNKPLLRSPSSLFLAVALDYLARGWSVIPLRPNAKTPLLPWQPFQKSLPTDTQVRGWWKQWPSANVGIVTGAISALAVLDIDPRHGGGDSLAAQGGMRNTPTVGTGGGGWHYYFAGSAPTIPSLLPGIDLKGEGSYVVAPLSVHPSGRAYAWEPGLAPGEVPLAPLPDWVMAAISQRAAPGAPNRLAPQPPRAGGWPAYVPDGDFIARLEAALERAGARLRPGRDGWLDGKCPFHDDRNPSFGVNFQLGAWVCFSGCGSGSLADLARRLGITPTLRGHRPRPIPTFEVSL